MTTATSDAERRDVTESGLRLVLITIAVMLAALMQALDSTITNVALPTIQGNLGASQDEGTWVITSYTVAAIVVVPITPWLQRRFGRKAYLLASIIGFTLASVVCGSSDNLYELIVARAVQGAFGGGLLATSQAILRDSFPPRQLGLSQGLFAIGIVMGPALGPTLGGIIVDNYSWKWCFDINVVPGTISTILFLMLLQDPEPKQKLGIDAVGLSLLAVTLGTMQYVLTEGEQNYWLQDPVIATATIVCTLTAVGFLWWEMFGTQTPIVDMRILANRSVAAGTILSLVYGAMSLGTTYTLPQFTQGPLGFTPTLSGLLFLVRAVPILFVTLPLVSLTAKIDTRVLVGFGFALVALSSAMQGYGTTLESSFATFVLPLSISGVGVVTIFTPLTIAVLGATTPEQGSKATSFLNLAQQLGGSVSTAVMSVLIDRREAFHSTILGATATLHNFNVTQFPGSIAQLSQLIYTQSTVMSYADATFFIAMLSAVSIPLVFLLKTPRRRQSSRSGNIATSQEVSLN